MAHLDSIYVFCDEQSKCQGWAQDWTKIKGVHTNIEEIYQALQLTVKQRDRDSIAVSCLTINEMASTDSMSQLEPTFMYTQIFKEILLDIEYDDKAIRDFAVCCRKVFSGNPTELNIIDRFERNYRSQRALWWYTRDCFTYKMLNHALRMLDTDLIIKMGFFLRDVHQQLEQLHQEQGNSFGRKPFIVYRGQGLIKSEFEKLQKSKRGLMSFNSLLTTSTDKEVSLRFTRHASTEPNKVGVLFVMSIDPSIKSAPFVFLKDVSAIKKEDEILFSMHTVFRVNAIKQMNNKNQLYQVELELTSDDDQQVRVLTDRIRKEADGTGWQRLGNLLLKIGHISKAEELYNTLIKQTPDEEYKTLYYNQLGLLYSHQGDYENAVWYYEKTLEIEQKILASNDPDLASSCSNIGNMYSKMKEYSKALSFYEKALGIRQKAYLSYNPSFGISYNNIGMVFYKMGDYLKALSFYEKALGIWQITLPSNHLNFASSYNNIGSAYYKMGEYSKALSSHEKALEIQEKTLPLNHPDLATSYWYMGSVYNNMKDYSKALLYFERALDIFQCAFPPTHLHIKTVKENIKTVKNKI
ncbi:unnamed protein product [Adineta steineri]|uniref:NAD(P)(+)--arginine ADP-ribosyltransferase n=1 Tax=Adineta steineri TaxID=433720 RepID=A0A814A4W1_9BILA|nr:unnamed protein product [Adineta steineri]CAF1148367.1 unnamed protein product [Adineta steineri]